MRSSLISANTSNEGDRNRQVGGIFICTGRPPVFRSLRDGELRQPLCTIERLTSWGRPATDRSPVLNAFVPVAGTGCLCPWFRSEGKTRITIRRRVRLGLSPALSEMLIATDSRLRWRRMRRGRSTAAWGYATSFWPRSLSVTRRAQITELQDQDNNTTSITRKGIV